jgi:hypothetical protein
VGAAGKYAPAGVRPTENITPSLAFAVLIIRIEAVARSKSAQDFGRRVAG